MDGDDTGFTDKQGKPIHYGDILQIGLDASSRTRKRVIYFGKKAQLVGVDDANIKYGGYNLSLKISKLAVIVDHPHESHIQ